MIGSRSRGHLDGHTKRIITELLGSGAASVDVDNGEAMPRRLGRRRLQASSNLTPPSPPPLGRRRTAGNELAALSVPSQNGSQRSTTQASRRTSLPRLLALPNPSQCLLPRWLRSSGTGRSQPVGSSGGKGAAPYAEEDLDLALSPREQVPASRDSLRG